MVDDQIRNGEEVALAFQTTRKDTHLPSREYPFVR